MGVLSSLYTGVTGINANGTALGIISDNIANANTIGFKTSRAEFSDVIAKSLKGNLGGDQIGRGTSLAGVKQIFAQGNITQTDRLTDLAITGDGFFVLDGEGRAYSRNGSFNFNKEGALVNSDGLTVMGFAADKNGEITTKLKEVKVSRNIIDAERTQEITMSMNLDIRDEISQTGFTIEDPDKTSNYSTGVTVYDSSGNSHIITVYFTKTGDNQWSWNATAKGEDITGGEKGKAVIGANGTLAFNQEGKLLRSELGSSSWAFNKGALPDQQIAFDFGNAIESGGTGLIGSTQYGSENAIYSHSQDGFSAGTVAGLSFNDDGILSALYTNGVTQNLSQIAIAKFQNNEGLFKAGRNLFKESRTSGQPNIGQPNNGGRGKIFSKTIESSTTDIATEFISLIQMQRAFQASARTMTASDELMQEVLNMRRA